MAIEQMKCYSELEHLFYRVYPALKNFPAAEKFCLCSEIKLEFMNALKNMSLASSVKSKRKVYLYEAESNVQHLNTLLRFARNQKYIGKGFYEDIDLILSLVKRLLSGWIKENSQSSQLIQPKENNENTTKVE